MKVKCISPRLNHVVFGMDGSGKSQPHKIQVGDVFEVKAIPPEWRELVVSLDGSQASGKLAVTNPAEPEELTSLKAKFREAAGRPAHHTWDAEKIREKLEELNKA